jgi:hypothetical protein
MAEAKQSKSRAKGLYLDQGGIEKHPRITPSVKSISYNQILPSNIGFENIIEFSLVTPSAPTRLPVNPFFVKYFVTTPNPTYVANPKIDATSKLDVRLDDEKRIRNGLTAADSWYANPSLGGAVLFERAEVIINEQSVAETDTFGHLYQCFNRAFSTASQRNKVYGYEQEVASSELPDATSEEGKNLNGLLCSTAKARPERKMLRFSMDGCFLLSGTRTFFLF